MRYQNIFRLWRDSVWGSRRGAVAVLFALTLVPLLIGAGMATDFARMQILTSSLQTIADSAALAGASALNQNSDAATSEANAMNIAKTYFKTGYAALTDNGSLTTLSVPLPTDNITVTVGANVTLNMTLMSLFTTANQSIGVFAKARALGYTLKVVPGTDFTSNAADANTIFYYVIPTGGGHPTVTPTGSATYPTFPGFTPLFSNAPAYRTAYNINNSTASINVGPNDQIGFAMFNVTGGNNGSSTYPQGVTNAYGGILNSQHGFFSNLAAPSMDPVGYATQQKSYTTQSSTTGCVKTKITLTTNTSQTYYDPTSCGVGNPCVEVVNGVAYQNNLMVNGQCSTPASATLTCLQLYENPTTFSWGDMGGTLGKTPSQDDFDYANEDYTVECVPNTTGTGSYGQPNAVILVQ